MDEKLRNNEFLYSQNIVKTKINSNIEGGGGGGGAGQQLILQGTDQQDTTDDENKSILQRETAIISYRMYTWEIKTPEYVPLLENYPLQQYDKILEAAQKWVRFPGKMLILFPIQTIQPIIRTSEAIEGNIPIEVRLYRIRKQYANVNLEELFSENSIEKWLLIPVEVMNNILSYCRKRTNMFKRRGLFPLDWFDDSNFDEKTPKDWLNLGLVDGVRHPVPAKAFLPIENEQEFNERLEELSKQQQEQQKQQKQQQQQQQEQLGQAQGGGNNNNNNNNNVDNDNLSNNECIRENVENLYSWRYVAVRDYDYATQKWIVQDLDTTNIYKVPRLYIMFIAENPYTFVDRVKYALKNRDASENLLKFELIVDCLLVSSYQQLSAHLENKIHKIVTLNAKSFLNQHTYKDLIDQVSLMYNRTMIRYEYTNYMTKNPEQFSDVVIPDEIKEIPKKPVRIIERKQFIKLRKNLKRIHILYNDAAVLSMYKVINECKNIENAILFNFSLGKNPTLGDFLDLQRSTSTSASKFIKGFWIDTIAEVVYIALRSVGKGWLDLTVKDWWIYKVSKIYRFIRQIKLRMTDAVQFFLENSINQYSAFLLQPCEPILDVKEDFVWTNNLQISHFRSTSTIFYLVISISVDGPYYSTPPDEFAENLTQLLKDAVQLTAGIRQIDASIMKNLVFAKNLFIPSTENVEDLFTGQRDLIKITYEKAAIPLKAYAKLYEPYASFYLLNVNDYLSEFSQNNHTSQEVKEEIQMHRRLKQDVELSMPPSITIGPFLINVDILKQYLIDKRTEVIRRLLEYFSNRMHITTTIIVEEFEKIMTTLTEKPSSIEKLLDVRKYLEVVPTVVDGLYEKVQIALLEYDILDYYYYNLSDDHFALKWKAIAFPNRILKQIPFTREQQKIDLEDFKRIQVEEIFNYEARLEAINQEIQAYSLVHDPDKALETSIEIKKTMKTLSELKVFAALLQSRQPIFDLPELDLNMLDDMENSFAPYNNLWKACANFLRLQDLAYENPLTYIDFEDIKKSAESIEATLVESLEMFTEKPEISEVVNIYLKKVADFKPSIQIIECLKSPDWTILHWQELARVAKIDIKYTIAINFSYCIKKGILQNISVVQDICQRATFEAKELKEAQEAEERLKKEAEMNLLRKRKERKGRTDI